MADLAIPLPRSDRHRDGMARIRRSHLPGAVFHLTARTQGHEPWFTETLRSRITGYMASEIRMSDTQLLAFAIMPNHLHLVVRQGNRPLSHLMQPLLLRTALLVQRSNGFCGHVFERRFRDRACLEPTHVRNAVVYTHLNPVRARLARDPASYKWSSHALCAAPDAEPRCMAAALATKTTLGLFATHAGQSVAELRRAYIRHVERRLERDQHDAQEAPPETAFLQPSSPMLSDEAGSAPARISPCDAATAPFPGAAKTVRDPEHIARDILVERAPLVRLAQLRSNFKGREVVRARRAVIVRLSGVGYRTGAIARYLRVTDQCVSNVLSAERRKTAGLTG